MKQFFRVRYFFALLVFSLVTTSCSLDDGNTTIPIPDSNLVDLIRTESSLTTLVSALERADLISTLEGSGPFTILAPDNTAFTNFLSTAGFASVDDVPEATLRQVLLNHVVAGRIDAAPLINLQRNYLETLADGPSNGTNLALYFDAVDGITFNGVSTVTESDMVASNGLYHAVDAVIQAPTLKTFISVDENFKSLDTALDLISPVSTLPTMLESDGPFTVFAPAENAFEDLLDTNTDWNFLSDIDENLLSSVVSHHALNGNILAADITTGQMLPSLEGDELTFNSVSGNLEITDGSGNSGILIGITDIQASNGVIHLIPDKVLLPDTTN